MNKDEMFNKLWFAYPNDLCRSKKGGKTPAKKAFDKLNPSEKEFNRIMLNLEAQARADRKDPDSYRWPFVSTYLNQNRFDDWTPEEERKKVDLDQCSFDNCTHEVMGRRFKTCQTHHRFEESKNEIRNQLKKIGLSPNQGENRHDYAMRCKNYYLANLQGTI